MITTKEFGTMEDGKVVSMYSISNSKGFQADVINYGAILVNLFTPDKDGKLRDVVLGFDKLESYYVNPSFFGSTIGPIANRTKDAKFELNGEVYQLEDNEDGNNLHSHITKGLHKVYWDAEVSEADNAVTFTKEMADLENGFPGNKVIKVTYTVTEDNEVKIDYAATSDKDTILNLTNHTYFNLSGHDSGNMEHSRIMIKADRYTEIVKGAIPTGNLPSVKGTPMDLTELVAIGAHTDDDFEQLTLVGGYDHNYAISKETEGVEKISEVIDDKSGIILETYTDLPGVQLYVGNFIVDQDGKNGAKYGRRHAFCLETQYFPNSANEPNFEKPVFGPNKPYATTTIYKFKTV